MNYVSMRHRKLRLAPTYYTTPGEVAYVFDTVADFEKTSVRVGQ